MMFIFLVAIIPMVISSSLLAKLILEGKDIGLGTEVFDQNERHSND